MYIHSRSETFYQIIYLASTAIEGQDFKFHSAGAKAGGVGWGIEASCIG